jgi:hypothetical protein
MKAIFFNNPLGTEKLSVIVTEKTVEELVSSDVIPSKSKYVIEEITESETLNKEQQFKLLHVDKLRFDDYKKPTKVLIDTDLLTTSFIEALRYSRSFTLSTLDNLQVRAMVRGKDELVKEIEEDKQLFRDFTGKISYADYSFLSDYQNIFPDIFSINYEEKYGKLINS